VHDGLIFDVRLCKKNGPNNLDNIDLVHVQVKNGKGIGQLSLADTVPSGNYFFVVSKYDQPEIEYAQRIPIINSADLSAVNIWLYQEIFQDVNNFGRAQKFDAYQATVTSDSDPVMIFDNLRKNYPPNIAVTLNGKVKKPAAQLSLSVFSAENFARLPSFQDTWEKNSYNSLPGEETGSINQHTNSEGLQLSGNIQKANGNILSEVQVYLYIESTIPQIHTTFTDLDGNFAFIDLFFLDNTPISLEPAMLPQDEYIVKLTESEESFTINDEQVWQNYDISQLQPYLLHSFKRQIIQSQYPLPVSDHSIETGSVGSNIYGEPYRIIALDEYIAFNTLENVFREIVPGVSIIQNKSGPEFRIAESRVDCCPGPPLVCVNYEPFINYQSIWSINPNRVDKIIVVKPVEAVRKIGQPGLNGVINIILKSGNDPNMLMETGFKYSFIADGFSTNGGKPVHQTSVLMDYPDFRDFLYWNPDIKTDDQGNINFHFNTSFFESIYYIQIEGIDGYGQAISELFEFEVSSEK
jgi:hypothetical protein